jgi:CheY-like chemotaxis protein
VPSTPNILDGSGLDVTAVETLASKPANVGQLNPQLVLLDIELPDGNGLDLMDDLWRVSPRPAVVVMTGHGADYAEQAIESGADDFLNKPFDAARLRVTLLNAADKQKLTSKLKRYRSSASDSGPLRGQSPAMQTVFETVESLAGTLATAFVMGESGTGKSWPRERFTSYRREHPAHLWSSIVPRWRLTSWSAHCLATRRAGVWWLRLLPARCFWTRSVAQLSKLSRRCCG